MKPVGLKQSPLILSEQGFSLVEVMIALAISFVVIGSAAYLGSQSASSANRQMGAAKMYLAMHNVSEELMMSTGVLESKRKTMAKRRCASPVFFLRHGSWRHFRSDR